MTESVRTSDCCKDRERYTTADRAQARMYTVPHFQFYTNLYLLFFVLRLWATSSSEDERICLSWCIVITILLFIFFHFILRSVGLFD